MVKLVKTTDKIDIMLDSTLFTSLILAPQVPKVVFYPLCTPSGAAVTRNMASDSEHPAPDHPHHRGLWTAHGDVNGVDFWEEYRPEHGKISCKNVRFSEQGTSGHLHITCDWHDSKGKIILLENRHAIAWRERGVNLLAMQSVLTSPSGTEDLVFGDTKEGGLAAIRVAPSMNAIGEGCILNAEGACYQRGQAGPEPTWGKRSRWVRYSGPVASEKQATIAIAHLPGSFRHPTWWHVRGYGLFAANPFAWSFFESTLPNGARDTNNNGEYRLRAGEAMISRFLIMVADGVLPATEIERMYDSYQPDSRSFGPDKCFDS